MMNRGKLEHILAYARQQKQFGSPACRIPPGDMVEIMERLLAQPVSGGYKLPDGFKLMPLEMTDEIGEAIAMEARCCGGIALGIYEAALAAAPDVPNGADQ